MSAPQEDGKLTAAKALFIGFFAAALGWAGVLVAAVAVAAEQTWADGRPERDRARERRRGWLDTQRAWLEHDHRERVDRAAALQDWLNRGASTDDAPPRRSKAARLGNGLHRLIANIAVAASDFSRHLNEGWRAADRTRKAGGGFRDIVRTRPDGTTRLWSCPGCGTAVAWDRRRDIAELWCDNCRSQQFPDQCSGSFYWECGKCPAHRGGYRTEEEARAAVREHMDTKHGGGRIDPKLHEPEIPPAQQAAEDDALEGEPMTQPTAPAESNATVLATKLTAVNNTVTSMSADVDELGVITQELREKVTRAADLAHQAGMPTAAVAAVDAIQHAAAAVDARLDDFAAATAGATDPLTAAVNGLTPVTQAEDKLHAAGADGRALDTVGV